MPDNNRPRRGFTLIEVLIAWALVSFLIIGGLEILTLAARFKMKADANLELTDLAGSRLEERKAALGSAAEIRPESEADPFMIVGRRRSSFRGAWRSGAAPDGSILLDFEIYPELEPEAVLALTFLYCSALGF
jgi:prepilin-type N-terminal cleavage/methylation domain-containing protein